MKKSLCILVITGFPCIRALKEAQALKNRGHTIILCCTPSPYNKTWNTVADTIITYQSPLELEVILKKVAPQCDIVHGHNEPNWPIACAVAYVRHCPVIYDCHDFSSLRASLSDAESSYEKICFEGSDAVIHVSRMLDVEASQQYTQKRTLVLYSLPAIRDTQFQLKKKFEETHVVYQGGLTQHKESEYNYRYYYDYFKELAISNIPVDVYPTIAVPEYVRKTYSQADTYIHVYPTVEYERLLYCMSAATWGFTGFYRAKTETDSKASFLDYAMPNKLFEYLLAGVTPIVINCKEAGQFVTEHTIGYHVKNMDEYIDIVHHAPQLVQNLDRKLIDMHLQIVELEKLYYDLLGIL